jgi:hypothetical protein
VVCEWDIKVTQLFPPLGRGLRELHSPKTVKPRSHICCKLDLQELRNYCRNVLGPVKRKQITKFESKSVVGDYIIRIARWYIFKPKIPILVNFGGSFNGRCLYISCHLVYFVTIWYILWPFGIFSPSWYIFPVLVYCTKKNPATLNVMGLALDYRTNLNVRIRDRYFRSLMA